MPWEANMMITLQGALTHLQHATATQSGMQGQITSHEVLSFRVKNHAVGFRSRSGPSISENDLVTVAGWDSKGTLQAYALRNDTTGAVYKSPGVIVLLIGSIFLVALGLVSATLSFFLGAIPLATGLGFMWHFWKLWSSNRAVVTAAPIHQA